MVWDDEDRGKFQNDLINQRLGWLGVFEGLLFIAYSHGEHPILLPLVGIVIAISIGVGTHAANVALGERGKPYKNGIFNWLMPGTALPVIIGVAWFLILMEYLGRCYCRMSVPFPCR